ncbi:MAG TPA: hypothetical protein VGE07_04045 [Herpetosiphonaceae bacterium]
MSHQLHHRLVWDDAQGSEQVLDAESAMRRLAGVLGADFSIKPWRGEDRYFLDRREDGLELSVTAGHIYDTRELLTLAIEIRAAGKLIASYGCSQGVERIKASADTAWLRTPLGTVVILGNGPGGWLEVQD